MKVTAISDLHGYLPDTLPGGDVLCIAGDISPLEAQRNMPQMSSWLRKRFCKWANKLPYDKVLLVAGNHDFFFESPDTEIEHALENSEKIIYLKDKSIDIKGKKFYGSPWVSGPQGWAFYDPELKKIEETFEKGVDVAIFHQPMTINYNGSVLIEYPWLVKKEELYKEIKPGMRYRSYGSEILDRLVEEREPKWVLTGHVHSGNHLPTQFKESNIVNVSIKDETYCPTYKPFEFEI